MMIILTTPVVAVPVRRIMARRRVALLPIAQRNAEILGLINSGLSYTEIAFEFKITAQRVDQIARKNGVEPRLSLRRRQEAKAARVADKKARRDALAEIDAERGRTFIRLVEGGLSFAKAGHQMGLSRGQTQWLSRKLDLVPKHSRWQPDLPERRAAAIAAIGAGASYAEAAAIARVTSGTARYWWLERGVE